MPRSVALLVGIVWLVIVVNVWSKYGVLWGLLALLLVPFLLSLVLGLGGRGVLALTKPGWSSFVAAWERRIGDRGRGGWDIPDNEVLAMHAAYAEWRRERKIS